MPDQYLINRFRGARSDPSLVVLEGFHPLKHALRFGAEVEAAVGFDSEAVLRLGSKLAPDILGLLEQHLVPVPKDDFEQLAPVPPATGVIALASRPAIAANDILMDGTVKAAAPGCDLFAVVGAPNSSNSRRLVEVALKAGAERSILLQRASEIDWDDIGEISTLGLSAGASAPEVVVAEIIDAFRDRFDVTIELAETTQETENFLVNRELRDVELTIDDMAFVNGTN